MSGYAPSMTEPSLVDLLRDLWRAKFAIIIGTVLGLVASLVFTSAAVPLYRAEILVGPAARSSQSPDINALLPDNSSFAVQYLINSLGSGDTGDFARYENILRAPGVAALLLHDATVPYAVQKHRPFSFLKERNKPETAEDLATYLQDKIAIEPVGTTALRRIVFRHPDRDFAALLLNEAHKAADNIIKTEIRARTEARATYLERALAEVSHPDHRRALTSLLMEQEHVKMILAMDEPFAAMVAEPAYAGPRPDWPKKSLFIPAFVFAGAFLGYVLSLTLRNI